MYSPTEKLTNLTDQYSQFNFSKAIDTTQLSDESPHLTAKVGVMDFKDADTVAYETELFRAVLHSPEGSLLEESAATEFAKLSLMKEMARQSHKADPNTKELMRHELELYDHFSQEQFNKAVALKLKQLSEFDFSDAPIAAAAKARITSVLEALDIHTTEETEINKEAIAEVIGDWLQRNYQAQLGCVDEQKESYDAYEIAKVFENVIALTPELVACGWHVKVRTRGKSAITVSSQERCIIVSDSRVVEPKKLKQLIVHEVLGHALRSANAEISGINEGIQGTATYSRFEEAFMVALEQCLVRTVESYRGIDSYIAIGLAAASQESEPLDKEAIKKLIFDIKYTLEAGKKGRDLSDKEIAQAKIAAQSMFVRTYAGMLTGEGGAASMVDINYYYGADSSWSLLQAFVERGDIDTGMKWIMSGKFNPFNATDQAIFGNYSDSIGSK